MKLNKNNKIIMLIFIIIIIFLYHFFIHNGLEKIFCETYFDYNNIKRPLDKCTHNYNGQNLNCIGMPSGHAETATIISLILYYIKIIPFWFCILLIFSISIQRIIANKHSLIQVLMGITLGFMYFNIYKYFNLSIYSLLIVFLIGFILCLLVIYKIDTEVKKPIPYWVSHEMLHNIKKKQETSVHIKILSVYANAVIQNRTFITWEQLEKYLDIIIEKIQSSEQYYDAVIGIKTGGAILSDYISQKLNLPSYKVKLSRKEYNCNKNELHTIDDMIKKRTLTDDEFIICEPIENDLQGKNVILIDELIASGKTMNETIKYLKNEKNVNIIYPTVIAINKNIYKQDINNNINANTVINNSVVIWPWGYDN